MIQNGGKEKGRQSTESLESLVRSNSGRSTLNINQLKIAPKKIKGIKYSQRSGYVPIEFIIKEAFKDYQNYRAHSTNSTRELAKSINEVGLLEPLQVVYNTDEDKWYFIDGEGRFWACKYLQGKEVFIQIYYDVSKEDRLAMQISANATKTKIDAEDLSMFSKKLYRLLQTYDPGAAAKFDRARKKGKKLEEISVTEFSDIIGRHPSTVKKYFTFADLDSSIVDYVLGHRDEKLFSRAVKIGTRIKDKKDQKDFFFSVVKKIEKKEARRLSQPEFNDKINKMVETLSKSDFEFERQTGAVENGDRIMHNLFERIRVAKHYLEAFSNLLSYFPKVKTQLKDYRFERANHTKAKENIVHFLAYLGEQYACVTSGLPDTTLEKVRDYIEQETALSFKEKIIAGAHKKSRKKQAENMQIEGRILSIGEEIEFIPVKHIRMNPNQPRSYYDPAKIEALAEDIRKFGQIKPGLIRQIDTDKQGNRIYELLFGQSRYQSVVKAGVEYYKAFINNNLSDVEIGILQCMEDLSEEDSPPERANVLYKQFQLVRAQKELQAKELLAKDVSKKKEKTVYTGEDFATEYRSLASKKTILKAVSFMESDKILQNLARAKLIGYDAAIQISKLKPEEREDMVYTVMSSDLSSSELADRIIEIENARNQISLLDGMPHNFTRIFEQFELKTRAAFEYVCQEMSSKTLGERVKKNAYLFYQFHKLNQGIEQQKSEISKAHK